MNDPTSASRTPTAITRDGDAAIQIDWDDQSSTRWTASQLRGVCPCATCREKKRGEEEPKRGGPIGLPVLSAAEAAPLRIESMRPVGTYAYNIAFSDGHSSGIFQFELLYRGPESTQTT